MGAGRPGRRPRGRGDVLVFPDRELPDAYERTLPEVFPDFAPGNFSFLPETGKRVWTGFNTFQWDLNWSNPRVFVEMAEVLLNLANRGVEVLRLDAVGFIWKRLGTSCQNQPEVHDLLLALRACARIVVPAVVFKAEAIVSPVDLAAYPGVGRHHGRISDLAYHNSLMVRFWSAVATRDARLATLVLGRLPAKPASTAWATYLRCHDDIGWAALDEDAAATGWSGSAHRRFLADFYAGKFPGSFARYLDDPARAADNRWLHRPAMDWDLAGRRAEPGTVARRICSALVGLAEARRRTPHLHAATPVEVVDLQQPQLFAFMRRHPLGTLVAVHNVTEQPRRVSPMALYLVGHDPAGGPHQRPAGPGRPWPGRPRPLPGRLADRPRRLSGQPEART